MKIKVAHVLNNVVGGVDVYLRTLLENIDFSKFEVIIIYAKGTVGDYKKINPSIKEYEIEIKREINFWVDITAVKETIKILRVEKPNVIHCHSSKGGVFGRIAGKYLNIPTLYTPNAFSYLSTDKKYVRKIYQKIEQLLFTKNTYLLACSKSERDRAINELKLNNTKILLWENSIKPIEIQNEKSLVELPEEYICTISRPSFQKNLILLIEIFAKLKLVNKSIKLVIGGIGGYAPNVNELKNAISYYNLDKDVVLIPWIDRESVLSIVSKSKLYISTSRYEGLPYSVLESMALGIPAVVTNCDGNKDLIIDGENGFIIDEKDSNLFVQKINQLLLDNDLYQKFSTNTKERFSKNYNVVHNIKSLERIYRSFSNLKINK